MLEYGGAQDEHKWKQTISKKKIGIRKKRIIHNAQKKYN